MTTSIRLVWHLVASHKPISFKTPGLLTKISKQPSQPGGKGPSPLPRAVAAPVSRAAPLENTTSFQMMCVITFSLPYDFEDKEIQITWKVNWKTPRGPDNTKGHYFFLLLYARNSIFASAPPQVLDFTFINTFLSSLDYSSPFRFQLAAGINSRSFHSSFCTEARARCTALKQLPSHSGISSCSSRQFVHSASLVSPLSILI